MKFLRFRVRMDAARRKTCVHCVSAVNANEVRGTESQS